MEISFNASSTDDGEAIKRVKEAERKRELKAYQPTDQEVWFTGFETHTGKRKAGIFQTKVSDSDRRKLEAVYEAITSGELSKDVDDMKKFTKSHALRLYQELVLKRREHMIKEMIKKRPKNYITVTKIEQLIALADKLEEEQYVALDTETTGLNIFGIGGEEADKIVGIVLTLPNADLHYYVPFGHTTGEEQLSERQVFHYLRPYLESDDLLKILHNAKYDIHMLHNHGIEMGGFHFDTMVAMSILNENEMSYALKNLANKYGKFFGYEDNSATYEELFGKGGFEGTPLDIGSIYACKDGHLTWLFYQFIMENFEKQPELKANYFEIEQPITLVSVEMERNGFLIDLEYASEYAKDLETEVTKLALTPCLP